MRRRDTHMDAFSSESSTSNVVSTADSPKSAIFRTSPCGESTRSRFSGLRSPATQHPTPRHTTQARQLVKRGHGDVAARAETRTVTHATRVAEGDTR